MSGHNLVLRLWLYNMAQNAEHENNSQHKFVHNVKVGLYGFWIATCSQRESTSLFPMKLIELTEFLDWLVEFLDATSSVNELIRFHKIGDWVDWLLATEMIESIHFVKKLTWREKEAKMATNKAIKVQEMPICGRRESKSTRLWFIFLQTHEITCIITGDCGNPNPAALHFYQLFQNISLWEDKNWWRI